MMSVGRALQAVLILHAVLPGRPWVVSLTVLCVLAMTWTVVVTGNRQLLDPIARLTPTWSASPIGRWRSGRQIIKSDDGSNGGVAGGSGRLWGMSTTENDQPIDPKPDQIDVPVDGDVRPDELATAADTPRMAITPHAEGSPLSGDVTGPAPGESLASAIDGASRPDKVAIGLMVGVLALLLICVAFGLAAK